MPKAKSILRFGATLLLAASLLSCTKEDSGDSGGGGGGGGTPTPQGPGTTQCGVVLNGKIVNPVDLEDGEDVVVLGASGANLVVVALRETPDKPFLIKLHGVDVARNARKQQAAIDEIKSMTARGARFFKPIPTCQTFLGSEVVAVGALLTADGKSVNEHVVQKGFALPDTTDVCGGFALDPCYLALAEQNAIAGTIGCQFLWKPVADKDGNAVIHVESCNTRIVVNGEEFRASGAGNGRCSTGRGRKPGCAYGQATIQVFDTNSGLPYEFPNGTTRLTVNGCDRVELPCY